jgi:hypothetical protein
MRNPARYGEVVLDIERVRASDTSCENERRYAAEANETDQQTPRISTRSSQPVKHPGDGAAVSDSNFFALAAFIL